MLIRVLSDIHGNTEALNAVLEDPSGKVADVTLCLGDVVGYSAEPAECIGIISEACDVVVRGNHDSGVAGMLDLSFFNAAGSAAIKWTRGFLPDREKEWLAGLPIQSMFIDMFHLCHSNPADPESWSYMMHPFQIIEACEAHPGKVCLVGHTHLACAWTPSGGFSESPEGNTDRYRLINCGSVGQPRDRDPRAAYLLIDTDTGDWTHRRVSYDIDSTAEKIRSAGLPDVLWRRLYDGR